MSQQLINRSPDLKRLRDEGYEVEVRAGYLMIHNVPYVNSRREIARGALVSELTLSGDKTRKPDNHLALFTGDYPCNQDGSKITQIEHQAINSKIGDNLVARFSFSNKPPEGYPDYYQKMVRYITILSNPARSIDPTASAQTFKTVTVAEGESVFSYLDTASSRAGINAVSEKLKGWRIGIVGVGGTGSYVLDLVAKTPVNEIHLFDGDTFLQHNAFRAPGAPSMEVLDQHLKKVDYLASIYSNMHKNIVPHPEYVDETNLDQIFALDFIFLCMDGRGSKKLLIEKLEEHGKPFIDVGMGVELIDERSSLIGILRATTSTNEKRDHVRGKNRISFSAVEGHDDYAQNIQIADLNALNASLAVIKWKKLCGFYMDVTGEHNTTYTINDNLLTSEDLLHEEPPTPEA